LYSHLRFVTAASLIAFAGLIAVGVPALLLSADRQPVAARTDIPDPATTSCKRQDWLNFDPSCWSRRDLSGHDMPWTAGRTAPNAAKVEVASTAQKAAEQPLTEIQHTATVAQESVPQESVPQASAPQEVAQAVVPEASVPQEPAPQAAVPREPPPQAAAPHAAAPQAPAPQAPAPQEPVQQSNLTAPVQETPTVQLPATKQRHAAKPATEAPAPLPTPKKIARRDRTPKRPTTEALNAVRKFGDNLRDIPVSSYAADGTPKTIVIRPTSIQDVYYYSAPR
jgi:hypothetical protein